VPLTKSADGNLWAVADLRTNESLAAHATYWWLRGRDALRERYPNAPAGTAMRRAGRESVSLALRPRTLL